MTDVSQTIVSCVEQAGGTWGIVVEKLGTGECWKWNADQPFYAASLIKVPIMIAVFADVYEKKYAFSDLLSVRAEDLVGGAGVLQHMTPGQKYTIYDLVVLMIIQSDNTATNILIDHVGRERIREIMEKTGMQNSCFYNKLMVIPAELEGVNQVTAADMAELYRRMASGRIISYNSCLQMISILKRQQIRDSLPLHLPDPDPENIGAQPLWELAHKTGSVTNMRHDTGILYVGQSACILSVLSKDVPAKVAHDTIGRIGQAVYQSLAGN
ncbi:class A beta-lactamase-related serine hydrolase [Brevibacillus humidisoli]|uniref:serine hydrolase n=1 Tax=Brevibacillus humidisoli TaxID=2895522 RepID=UPI001E3D85A2|nr:serine hydrolase [Brevibacillus humidisoli]UFJ43258.1 class A beta-lactamase-related serine hydrolase [Brevibacillus humidisoli]